MASASNKLVIAENSPQFIQHTFSLVITQPVYVILLHNKFDQTLTIMLKSTSLDKFAIALSGVCLVHCLVTPVIITLLPILSLSALAEELLFHQLLLWLVIPVSVVALFIGCRKHRRWPIVLTGLLGMAILITVALLGHAAFGLTGEKIATSVGGLILACSHYLNYRACQSITCASRHCESQHHH